MKINNKYTEEKGLIFNINNLGEAISKISPNVQSYGANTTISYVGCFYNDITTFSSIIPVIENIYPDDYLLLEINIGSKEEMKNYNLLSFTNYSYQVKVDDVTTTTFASIDEGIQFFDKIVNYNTTVKICVCASKIIGNKFKDQGYIISKIPLYLLNISSFNYLIRVGTEKSSNIEPNLRDLISTTYYKSNNENPSFPNNAYYNEQEIIDSWSKPYLPTENYIYKSVQKKFQSLKDYISTNSKIVGGSSFYPYLSNFNNTNYAIQNIFDALTVSPPAQVQANDTGKSYYLTNYIDFNEYPEGYLYIISLNHNASNVCLSSNIQIYEAPNFGAIDNGTMYTGPDDANIKDPSYPIPSIIGNDVPTYNIFCYSCKNLIQSGISNVIISERLQYNLANFYHTKTNTYKGTSECYIFNEPLNDELLYLKQNYNINIKYMIIEN